MSSDCCFLSEKLIEQRRHSEAALLLDQYAKVRCIKFVLNGLNLLNITKRHVKCVFLLLVGLRGGHPGSDYWFSLGGGSAIGQKIY